MFIADSFLGGDLATKRSFSQLGRGRRFYCVDALKSKEAFLAIFRGMYVRVGSYRSVCVCERYYNGTEFSRLIATDRVWSRSDPERGSPFLSLSLQPNSLLKDFASLPRGPAVPQATGIKRYTFFRMLYFRCFCLAAVSAPNVAVLEVLGGTLRAKMAHVASQTRQHFLYSSRTAAFGA
ncbi:hypothetical protein EVAR_63457_1 [Eumeta japonica]|uniref:Uncharacterized protein n=1 Tax=Eumeta variegata TaxID=151549 RepID=A0A4C1YA34_EUMVA|nr:hypothetical protein EVAR_63457_1 [Eumeta japonica]